MGTGPRPFRFPSTPHERRARLPATESLANCVVVRVVHAPDLYDVARFADIETRYAHSVQVGLSHITDRQAALDASCPTDLAWAGFSQGRCPPRDSRRRYRSLKLRFSLPTVSDLHVWCAPGRAGSRRRCTPLRRVRAQRSVSSRERHTEGARTRAQEPGRASSQPRIAVVRWIGGWRPGANLKRGVSPRRSPRRSTSTTRRAGAPRPLVGTGSS